MAYLHDDVLDAALDLIDAEVDGFYICSALPTTYAGASSTNALGYKAAPTVSAPGDRTGGGRSVTVSAITDGEVTANGTASHYALVDSGASRLIYAAALASTQVVTDGNPFTTPAIEIGFPDVA